MEPHDKNEGEHDVENMKSMLRILEQNERRSLGHSGCNSPRVATRGLSKSEK